MVVGSVGVWGLSADRRSATYTLEHVFADLFTHLPEGSASDTVTSPDRTIELHLAGLVEGMNPAQREAVLHDEAPRSCWLARAPGRPAC